MKEYTATVIFYTKDGETAECEMGKVFRSVNEAHHNALQWARVVNDSDFWLDGIRSITIWQEARGTRDAVSFVMM